MPFRTGPRHSGQRETVSSDPSSIAQPPDAKTVDTSHEPFERPADILATAHASAPAIRPFVPLNGPTIGPTANPTRTALVDETHAPPYALSVKTVRDLEWPASLAMKLPDTIYADVYNESSLEATQMYLRPRRNRGYSNNTDGKDGVHDVLTDTFGRKSPFGSSGGRSSSVPRKMTMDGADIELPQYHLLHERVRSLSASFALFLVERLVASFTLYDQLNTASVDSDYSTIFWQLKGEWRSSVFLLLGIAAIDVTIYIISDGITFGPVKWNSTMKTAVFVSLIASFIGILCSVWCLFHYDTKNIKDRALDIFDSYLFFSLSSRVPALCHLVSVFSMLVFYCGMEYSRAPYAILVCCAVFGSLMMLPYLLCVIQHVLVKGNYALASVTHWTCEAAVRPHCISHRYNHHRCNHHQPPPLPTRLCPLSHNKHCLRNFKGNNLE